MEHEIKAKVTSIENLEIKQKIVKDKDGKCQIVTGVKFEVEADPNEFRGVLQTIAAGHQIDAMFSSPQLGMDMEPPVAIAAAAE